MFGKINCAEPVIKFVQCCNKAVLIPSHCREYANHKGKEMVKCRDCSYIEKHHVGTVHIYEPGRD